MNSACPQRTFRQQVPELARRYARRTLRLTATVAQMAITLAGRAGSAVLAGLGVAVSRSTVLRVLLDSAMGCAVHSVLPAGVRYTSLDLSVKFLRALGVDSGSVRCVGEVVHMGGRTALAEGRLLDGAGKLVAHATSTCMIMRPAR